MGDTVHAALVEVLGVPENDLFQVISEHSLDNLRIDRTYLGIVRSDAALIITITLREGRTISAKRNFYRAVADGLHHRVGLATQDVFISLTETRAEDGSFGNGEAQYAPKVVVDPAG